MAKENGGPTAEEKGKWKAVDKSTDGDKKPQDVKKDKDGKPVPNGVDAKDLEIPEGRRLLPDAVKEETNTNCVIEELSEEDQQLKADLEMMVERLKVGSPNHAEQSRA